jgi:hypothetical protein
VIEANSKTEIESRGNKIEETGGAELEINIQKQRSARLVQLSITEDTTLENAKETLVKQNPELDIKEGDIRAFVILLSGRQKCCNGSGFCNPKETNTVQN